MGDEDTTRGGLMGNIGGRGGTGKMGGRGGLAGRGGGLGKRTGRGGGGREGIIPARVDPEVVVEAVTVVAAGVELLG